MIKDAWPKGPGFGLPRGDLLCWKFIDLLVSVHGVVELVEIPNNKSQITNKFQ